jgi:hypothetical protein
MGAYSVALTYPEQERYQSYSNASHDKGGAAAPIAELPQSPQRRAPCVDPQSATDSDLCAQWRAARGAEKSAEWAMWGVLASIAGIIGLYWQIALTREAVQDTGMATVAMEKQNALAKDTAERQLRAYLAFVYMRPAVPEVHTPEGQVYYNVFKNVGLTPARNVRLICHGALFENGIPDNFDFALPDPIVHGTTIGAGLEWAAYCPPISQALIGALNADPKRVYLIWGAANYDDVFNDSPSRRTEFATEMFAYKVGDDQMLGMRTLDRFGGMDEDCRFQPPPREQRRKE